MVNMISNFISRYVSKKWQDTILIREYATLHRRRLAIGVFALLGVAVLDLSLPLIIAHAVDLLVEGAAVDRLALLAFLYLLVSCFLAVGRYVWRVSLYSASIFCGRDLRDRYVSHLHVLPKSFFVERRRGELIALANNDVEAVKLILGEAVVFFCDSILYILMIPPLMLYLSPRLTLLVGIPMLAIPFLVVANEKKIHSRFKDVQDAFGELSAAAQEALTGVRVVKAFRKEGALTTHYKECGNRVVRSNLLLARIESVFDPMLLSVLGISTLLMIFVGGSWVIDGAVSIGVFVAFQRYLRLLVWPMQALGLSFTVLQRAVASSDRLQSVLAAAPEVNYLPLEKVPLSGEGGQRIEFRDLTFTYSGSTVPALRNINLTIEAGEKIAILGEVGSGKTTMLQLIPRLYPVASGMLAVSGRDISDWDIHELRSVISYVPQESVVFSGSIYSNIAFGCGFLSPEIKGRVIESSVLAGLQQEVSAFSNGYDTVLGERGVKVSGGQRQRLTIARALMRDSSIVIFDDALSAVDLETEKTIIEGLRGRNRFSTDIVTGQRLSVLANVDRIVVLQHGRIVQVGSQEELMRERSGWFKLFYERQRLQEEMDMLTGKDSF